MTCAFFTLRDRDTKAMQIFGSACEVISILFVLGYIVNEIDEMEKYVVIYVQLSLVPTFKYINYQLFN